MQNIEIGIELNENSVLPKYEHEGDAGMDVRADKDYIIAPGETLIIPIGIKIAIPEGYEIQVRPRSGISSKTKIRVANAPGTIDSKYRDEVGVILTNTSKDYYWDENDNIHKIPTTQTFSIEVKKGEPKNIDGYCIIKKGDRIAQIVLAKVEQISWNQVEDITIYEGNRGGGYGHSGVK